MKGMRIASVAALFALMVSLFPFASAVYADVEDVTITGTITPEGFIMVDEDELYVILEDDLYDELMGGVGKKVEVTGSVEEKEGKKIIDVEEFDFIAE